MVTCAVGGCFVNHRHNPDNCTFHRFPLDPLIRGKWLKLIGRADWIPKKNSTICSIHFHDKFKRKSRKNTILVKGAIPTLFGNDGQSGSTNSNLSSTEAKDELIHSDGRRESIIELDAVTKPIDIKSEPELGEEGNETALGGALLGPTHYNAFDGETESIKLEFEDNFTDDDDSTVRKSTKLFGPVSSAGYMLTISDTSGLESCKIKRTNNQFSGDDRSTDSAEESKLMLNEEQTCGPKNRQQNCCKSLNIQGIVYNIPTILKMEQKLKRQRNAILKQRRFIQALRQRIRRLKISKDSQQKTIEFLKSQTTIIFEMD